MFPTYKLACKKLNKDLIETMQFILWFLVSNIGMSPHHVRIFLHMLSYSSFLHLLELIWFSWIITY